MEVRSKCNDIFNFPIQNKYQPSENIHLNEGKIRTFSEKQKPKKYIMNKPKLNESL